MQHCAPRVENQHLTLGWLRDVAATIAPCRDTTYTGELDRITTLSDPELLDEFVLSTNRCRSHRYGCHGDRNERREKVEPQHETKLEVGE
jgi:hypothetical protein